MNGCRYWIGTDATGHRCGAEPGEQHGYCEKHYAIMLRRAEKRLELERDRAARDNAAWLARNAHKLPAWRVQLERAESEYQHRTAPAVDDRAAVGGNVHGSIVRASRQKLSDSNVTRVLELERIVKQLRADIARAEAGA
jgi:hypothetical protein